MTIRDFGVETALRRLSRAPVLTNYGVGQLLA
jgi:hypothetical protein